MKMDESTTENSSTSLPDNVLKEEDSGADPTMLEENVHPLGMSCTDGEIETVVVKQEIIETFDTKIEPIEDSDVTGEKKPSTNIPKDEDEQDIKQEIVWVEEMNYENDNEASAQIGGHFLDGGESSKADGPVLHALLLGLSSSSTSPQKSSKEVGEIVCTPDVMSYDKEKPCDKCESGICECVTKTKRLSETKSTPLGEVKQKRFRCSQCGYETNIRSNLVKHKLTHEDKSTWSILCDECGYVTNQQRNLVLHKRCHSKEKPYTCDYCAYRTANPKLLRNHRRTHTGEKPYACDKCDFRSAHRAPLANHKRAHNNDKPYACSQCDYRSTKNYNLKTHMRIHNKERPFACCLCDYKASHNVSLRIHIENVHS